MNLTTNAGAVARAYQGRIDRWDRGAQAGLKRIALTVHGKATRNLTGGVNARDYPVPVRTGFLRRSGGVSAQPGAYLVFNSSRYAQATEDGFHPYGNRRARRVQERPFLTDAANDTDQAEIMALEMRRVVYG